MKRLEWNESFSVNVAELDQQHQKLFDLINLLYEVWQSDKDSDREQSVMNEMSLQYTALETLYDYTVYHFGTEERYMEQAQYPEYERQKVEHEGFTQKIDALQEDFRNGKPVDTAATLKFLIEWMKNHILGLDKKYGPCLNKCGLH